MVEPQLSTTGDTGKNASTRLRPETELWHSAVKNAATPVSAKKKAKMEVGTHNHPVDPGNVPQLEEPSPIHAYKNPPSEEVLSNSSNLAFLKVTI